MNEEQISEYFKWREFDIYGNEHIDIRSNIDSLVYMVMDVIREKYGEPIYITSGYRTPKENFDVGGVATSQHLTGEACDFTGRDIKKLWRVINELINDGELIFDQMIYYRKSNFIHVSYKANGEQRKQLLIKR